VKERSVNVFLAMSGETRLRLLEFCARKQRTTEELTELLGVNGASVHHHLVALGDVGLVESEIKEGRRYQHRTVKEVVRAAISDLKSSARLR
jgi:DNA-binding transcriptional ArsR family regulator